MAVGTFKQPVVSTFPLESLSHPISSCLDVRRDGVIHLGEWGDCRGVLRARILETALNKVFHLSGLFIEVLLSLPSSDAISERVHIIEFRDSFLVEVIDTFKGLASKHFLMVGQEKTSELSPLEKVFAMVLILRLCKHLSPV